MPLSAHLFWPKYKLSFLSTAMPNTRQKRDCGSWEAISAQQQPSEQPKYPTTTDEYDASGNLPTASRPPLRQFGPSSGLLSSPISISQVEAFENSTLPRPSA
ncbi:unnamed protein product [Cuscuta europaea]|uniref:Uncharacterized protein n=1 Tax=Cuscuta europaea TaxID=41803 RepID=A0A9P0Z2W5_CUSEU|nr:unnamed protein product [Cuscuta europaea]